MDRPDASPRPVIAITSHVVSASWETWHHVPVALLPTHYLDHIAAVGGIAIVLPPLPRGATAAEARAVLDRVDGLIISGGPDIDPARYGQEPHPTVQGATPERDESELLLASVSAAEDVPFLGVCRGMQVMAVAAGGSLVQHLPDRVGHLGHSPEVGRYGSHDIRIDEASRLHTILGRDITVATYHHQGVDDLAGYRAAAWADDGVVEAIEDVDSVFRIGVQWHPERGDDQRLFEHLVAAARRRLESRSRG